MSFFTPLEGSALLCTRGVYTEAKLYELGGELFVQRGRGFLKLLSHERTSDAKVSWRKIQGVPFLELQGLVRLASFSQAA